MDLSVVTIEKSEASNVILGQSHFIKTVEDMHEAIVQTNGAIQFGLAFCEASGPALVRYSCNDERLIECAKKNAMALACGHAFILFIEKGFPINILNAVKNLPEVCRIFCATSNPVEVIVAETPQGRGIVGVIDGAASKGVETDTDIRERKALLRAIGYKL